MRIEQALDAVSLHSCRDFSEDTSTPAKLFCSLLKSEKCWLALRKRRVSIPVVTTWL